MLVEFRVKNFRSIRDEQCLSLVASKDSSLEETNTISTGISATPRLVTSAVMYGANASGKSNLINALGFMQSVVKISATQMQEGQAFNCPKFKLDSEYAEKPSEFEVTFILEGVRYQYGFSLLPSRVAEEWLLVYKHSKPQAWFNRSIDPKSGKDSYEFSSHLTGQRKVWQESTRTNALFLSKAVDMNSERLRPIFLWFVERLRLVQAGHQPIFDFSITHAQSEKGKQEILNLLNAADLSISDLSLVTRKMKQVGVRLEDGTPSFHSVAEFDTLMPVFLHNSEKGSAQFELPDESAGTQKYFAFTGVLIDVLNYGHTLVVDELDNSMHPLLIRFMLKMFNSVQKNKAGAQLIFSTHDTSLLDSSIFRRDQVWFLEKDRDQSTKVYPLTQFSPRKNEALEKGYLMGRYGAVPFFGDYGFENP